MKDLSPEARRLLELARPPEDPDVAVQSRVARALAAKIASSGAAGGQGTAPMKSVGGSGVGLSAIKMVMVAGLFGAAVVAGWVAVRPSGFGAPKGPLDVVGARSGRGRQEAPSTASMSAAVDTGSAVHEPVSPIRKKTGQVVRRARGSEGVSPAAPPPASDPLAAETAALLSTQRALRQGDARLALALLDDQDATYSAGALQEERGAARVLALCQSHRATEARAEAARFERRWPHSVLLGRVRSACRAPAEP
jgi:hypothetical protein